MNSAISFKQVSKTFPPDVHALQSINLEVAEGEFLVVVGPSGCGKSTLLRLVAGLENQTNGSIHIFGKDSDQLAPQERNVGMVFQNYALFPHLSVFENMAYGLKVRRESAPETRKKVEGIAQKLEIFEFLRRKPNQLSGGQRQRVALGRLLVRDPKIHLFDEPLGNLDPQFRAGMRSELARLHRENPRSSIYVTHDQAEAMTLGQRICVLRKGEVLQVGTPEEIYDLPSHRFVAEFFGSPGVNCIDGKIVKKEGKPTEFRSGSIQFPLPNHDMPAGSITLGIRPENWTLSASENGVINGVIERVENLGDHRLIQTSIDDFNIFIKTTRSDIKEKEAVSISPQWEKAHWFERYTGKRI